MGISEVMACNSMTLLKINDKIIPVATAVVIPNRCAQKEFFSIFLSFTINPNENPRMGPIKGEIIMKAIKKAI